MKVAVKRWWWRVDVVVRDEGCVVQPCDVDRWRELESVVDCNMVKSA